MLDDFFAAHAGDVGILSRIASRSPLTEKIPVLIEPYRDLIEALAIVFGQSRAIAVLEQTMLFGNEAFNMLVYLRIVHGRNLPRVSEALL
jgi:hypothetical protein